MPTPYLQELHKELGISIDKLEKLWDKAKSIAAKQGKGDNYGYITGILKKMTKADEADELPTKALELIDKIDTLKNG